MAPGTDERMRRIALLGTDGDAGEIEAVEHVRVDELGRKVEGNDVEVGGRPVGVDRKERQSTCSHERLEVEPRCIRAFGDGVGSLVEDLVEDLKALVGETDFVGVGIGQEPRDLARAVFRSQRSQLTADVAGRLLHLGQERLEPGPQ